MIYLDNAAATPVSDKVLAAMEPYFTVDFFNPSAAYLPAKKVAADYEKAKGEIAHAIGAKSSDLVITAGATEANNLAFSCIKCMRNSSKYVQDHSIKSEPPVKLTTAAASVLYLETEHASVRAVAERYGGKSVKVLPNGVIDLVDLKNKLDDNIQLISVALVNNELGIIQPLVEISMLIQEVKIDRLKRNIKNPLYLHSDASQAINLLDINVARLGVDLLTINAAKIYGPKGIGALYVSHNVKLSPISVGGGQENGLRAGTENVPGVMGFAKAISEAKKHINGNRKKYANWRKIMLQELQGYELINKKHSLDNFIVLCYNGIDAERLIFLLEDMGVYVATGAACAANKGIKSHVLKAIGLSDSQITGSLRITIGETNTEEQIHEAVQAINDAVIKEYKRTTE